MRRNQELPRWLVGLMILAGVIFLGPPVLGFLLGAVGLAVGLVVALLKLGLIALGVYVVLLLLRAVFGKSSARPVSANAEPRLEDSLERLERDDAELRALDRELERAVAASRK